MKRRRDVAGSPRGRRNPASGRGAQAIARAPAGGEFI